MEVQVHRGGGGEERAPRESRGKRYGNEQRDRALEEVPVAPQGISEFKFKAAGLLLTGHRRGLRRRKQAEKQRQDEEKQSAEDAGMGRQVEFEPLDRLPGLR